MLGVELIADKATGAPYLPDGGMAARVVAEALERGVWGYPAGDGTAPDALLIGPPFTITEEEMDTVVTVVGEAITEVCGDCPVAHESQRRRFRAMARSASRTASRFASSWRWSLSRRPRASAISTLARPFEK